MTEKLKPARSAALESEKSYRLVADLDEFLTDVYTIKVLGKVYEMKPITGNLLRSLDTACGKALEIGTRISKNENIPYDTIVKTYHEFCQLIIPKLTLQDLHEMTVKQMNELLKVCFKFATHQELDDGSTEKKNLLN